MRERRSDKPHDRVMNQALGDHCGSKTYVDKRLATAATFVQTYVQENPLEQQSSVSSA